MAKRDQTAPFIVSYGAESLFLDRDLERARGWSDRSVVMLDGDGLDAEELVSECESNSFDVSERVIIVDNANKVKGEKPLKKYIDGKDRGNTAVVLVAIVRDEKLPDIWREAGSKGKIIHHPKLKTYDSNNEVMKWIPDEVKRIGARCEKDVPELLFKFIGGDLYKIASEIRKLAVLAGDGEKITREHVIKVVVPIIPADPFKVVESAMQKDLKGAMNALASVYKGMGDDATLILSFSLMRQVEKLVVARYMLDRGSSEDEIAGRLDMHPWRCKTFFLPIVRRRSLASLVGLMSDLCRLDVDVKGPGQSKRTRVELAVLALAG